KRAYCLKTQPATGETYPKSDLFNKAIHMLSVCMFGMYSYFVLYIVFRCDLVCQLIAFKKYVL
ncbi:hypothetical protein PGJBOOGM_23735, partial [Escherichia coli]|nr:hypothetical protein [Escherichia coli]MEC4833182.1 hypothetical protein [Escherichia coli]